MTDLPARPVPAPDAPSGVCHVVTHVHWDREWYRPFESFRARLAELAEQICDQLDDRRIGTFHLDGQTIVLTDIAAVRPDLAERLKEHARAGRLTVGPWHVLADNQLVSGENLIRNLLAARRAGAGSRLARVGYSPDAFGHPADLPRILRGFGMDTALVWRGAPPGHARFRWRSPDGSEVFAVNQGYHAADVLWPDPKAPQGDDDRVTRFLEGERRRLPAGPWLLMNGGDHLAPTDASARIAAARAQADAAGAHLVESSLEDFFAAAREAAGADLPVVTGELRAPGDRLTFLLPGTISARTYLKQANDAAQTLLERWAEPLVALHAPPRHHPAGRTAPRLGTAAAQRTARLHLRMQRGRGAPREHRALRPRPRDRRTHRDPCAGRRGPRHPFVRGAPARPCRGRRPQPARRAPHRPGRSRRPHRTGPLPRGPVRRGRPAGPLRERTARQRDRLRGRPGPASRLAALTAPPAAAAGPRRARARAHPVHDRPRGRAGRGVPPAHPCRRTRVLHVARPSRGRRRRRLAHRHPSRRHRTQRCGTSGRRRRPRRHLRLRPARRGPPRHTPPAHLRTDQLAHRTARCAETVTLPVTTDITVWADDPAQTLHWEVTVDNAADDHRLRAHFPAAGTPATWLADGHFSLVERPVAADLGPLPEQPGHEAVCGSAPVQSVASLGSGGGRTAVAAPGVPEFRAVPVPGPQGDGAELVVTLLRCVGWLSRFDLTTRTTGAGPMLATPEAQCHGTQRFAFATAFGEPVTDDLGLAAFGAATRVPLRACQLRPGEIPPGPRSGPAVSGGALLTALKPAEDGDGWVLRLSNPTAGHVPTGLRLGTSHAEVVNLDESATGRGIAGDGAVTELPPHGLLSLRIR